MQPSGAPPARLHRELPLNASVAAADGARNVSDTPDGPASTDDDDGERSLSGIFIDPMMGIPLAIFIEKDVKDRAELLELIEAHGGTVSQGYSGVPYILVDPHRESGQNLHRQYANKKGKLVLDARWVRECINAGELQMFSHNWAGCKVTGKEIVVDPQAGAETVQQSESGQSSTAPDHSAPPPSTPELPRPTTIAPHEAHLPGTAPPVHQPLQPHPGLVFPYAHMYPPPAFTAAPRPGMPGIQPAWPAPAHPGQGSIMPHQTHITHPALLAAARSIPPVPPPHAPEYRHDAWEYQPPPPGAIDGAHPPYDYQRYREDAVWPEYYGHQYPPSYPPPPEYMQPQTNGPPVTHSQSGSNGTPSTAQKPRGRKRVRPTTMATIPPAALVLNRRNPPARSPTPPKRILRSTYGGNLFTTEDVEYLKRYIDYCQAQGLVLSLREICERVAVKAPHHTFYSWRRYCNKHHIRLGGYTMDLERPASPTADGVAISEENVTPQEPLPPLEETLQEMLGVVPNPPTPPPAPPPQGPQAEQAQLLPPLLPATPPDHSEPEPVMVLGPGDIAAIQQRVAAEPARTRSPSPPRALFRSTTGKGVAFTHTDIEFLVRLLEYRKVQGRMDMVMFWKDVAAKAPHHSRASWMKFYRRHKHELHHHEGDAPLPPPPEKKLRYSRADDILLAKYFATKPDGTSDTLFQAFARLHPHHPWKGWQEHHRIHKAAIDHLVKTVERGEIIDPLPEGSTQS